MKQLIIPNINTPYIGGYCEGFVEMAVGQATMNASHTETYGVYPTAIGNRLGLSAWDAQPVKHYDLPPKGLSVPVYLSLGSTLDGHTAWSLADGRIMSSSLPGYNETPYFYPDLDALIADYAKYNNGATYLGYGEYVGKIKVIGETEYMTDKNYVTAFWIDLFGIAPTQAQLDQYVGKNWEVVYNDLRNSLAHKQRMDYYAKVIKLNNDNVKIIADLTKENTALKAQPPVVMDTPPVNEQVVVQNWFVKLWNKLFK